MNMKQHQRTEKISSTTEEYNSEYNPIEDIIDILNYCRKDYYKLHKKNYKVASIRLRQNLEIVIQKAKQEKRNALAYRKSIEEREKLNRESDSVDFI